MHVFFVTGGGVDLHKLGFTTLSTPVADSLIHFTCRVMTPSPQEAEQGVQGSVIHLGSQSKTLQCLFLLGTGPGHLSKLTSTVFSAPLATSWIHWTSRV